MRLEKGYRRVQRRGLVRNWRAGKFDLQRTLIVHGDLD